MFKIHPIPAFTDNYIWLISHTATGESLVVDPGDANPILRYLDNEQLTLSGMLITHSHLDHTAGIDALLASLASKNTPLKVYGPSSPDIPQVTHVLSEGDQVAFHDLDFTVFHTPGHLPEHISYFATIDGQPSLFCGDTMFSAGCGRIFSGTHEQLQHSLERLAQLPPNTLLYCTHEYTEANLRFARTVEPDNTDIQNYQTHVANLRGQGLASLPSNIGQERLINPFIRLSAPSVKQAIAEKSQVNPQSLNDAQVFKALRQWKDQF